MRYSIFGENDYKQTISQLLNASNHIYDDENPEIVFSVGGDGTILRAIKKYQSKLEDIYFVGINFGRLGFYTDFEQSEMEMLIKLINNNQYKVCHYSLIEYSLNKKNDKVIGYALNELAIINPVHTQIIDVYISNEYFETFRGTGFLISTPTGSTAYNKSLGGSVIDPRIKAFQLTEIASINNRVFKTISSPLVLPADTSITLHSDYRNSFISADGIDVEHDMITKVVCRLSDRQVKFIVKDEDGFWNRVRKSFLE